MTAGRRPCRRNTTLLLGTDINFDKADVDAATRAACMSVTTTRTATLPEEIAIYEKAIETEKRNWP